MNEIYFDKRMKENLKKRKNEHSKEKEINLKTFNDIKHIYCINLKHREDRRENLKKEMEKLDLNYKIIEGIYNKEFGWKGCTESHLKCLYEAKRLDLDHILICEDDIEVDDVNGLKNHVDWILQNYKWDILLLSSTNFHHKKEDFRMIDKNSIRVFFCNSTACYLVRKEYYDTLIDNYELSKTLEMPLDKVWNLLAIKDHFLVTNPINIKQITSYSDIEKKEVNYSITNYYPN